MSQLDVGDFHATVEHNDGGQEIIRISRRDYSEAVPPTAHVSEPEKSRTPEEERWSQVRDLLLSTLTQGGDKGEVIVPAPVLRLYHQLLNKQVPGGTEASSAQLQAAWLLAELVHLGATNKEKTVTLTEKPAGQAVSESDVLIKGSVKEVPISRILTKSETDESNDNIVIGTVEESCDSDSENTDNHRTTSENENEVQHIDNKKDEL